VSEAASRAQGVAGVQGPAQNDRRLQLDVPAARDDGQQVDAAAPLGPHRHHHRSRLRRRRRQLPAEKPHDGAAAAELGGHRGNRRRPRTIYR